MKIRRGFNRIGLALTIPLASAALIAAIISLGFMALPKTVGPIFGFDNSDLKITAPDGTSFKFSTVLEQEQNGKLDAHRKELLEEARTRGLVPLGSNEDRQQATRNAARESLLIAAILAALALLWYAAAATIGWIISGFID